MSFFKTMQIKGKFKKGRIVSTKELPDRQDRDELLVKYSIANNIPILVSKQDRWGDLKYINPNVELYRFAKNFTFEVKEANLPNGVLVDESINDEEMIQWLKTYNIKICGGFTNEG